MTEPLDGLRDHARRTPPDLATVVALGAQRRRRELLGVSLAALVLAVGTALSFTGGYGHTRGLDSVTSTPGTDTPAPTGSAQPAADRSQAPAPVAGQPVGRTAPSASPSGVPVLPPPVGPSPTPSPSPRPGESGMTRTYSGDNPPTVQVGTANLCTTRVGTPSGGDPYCAEGATNAPDPHGYVIVWGNTCRSGDQVTDGQLTFGTTREMDFAVFQGGKLIWRWSTGRPAPKRYAHSLAVKRGNCWVWETTWRAVDRSGKARHGDFVLRTYAYAGELMDTYHQTDYRFTI